MQSRRLIRSMSDVSISDHTEKGLMLEMPPAEDLRHMLEALGISDRSRVIVYYGKGLGVDVDARRRIT